MGLLDVLNSEQGRLGLGLLAAAGGRSDGAGFGQRMAEGLGSYDHWKKQQAQAKLQKMQEEEMQAQIEARKAKAVEDARIKALIQGAGQPKLGMGAGLPAGTLPGAFDIGGVPALQQPGKIDFQGLIRQGVPFELAKQLADAENLGRQKVARTTEIEGPNGQKIVQGFDDYGQRVGQGENGYVAPVIVNQGGFTGFQKPVAGASFPISMSPSEKDASARGWASNALAKQRLALDQGAAISDAGGPTQLALNKKFGKPEAGRRWKEDGSLEPIPGGSADGTKISAEAKKNLAGIEALNGAINEYTGALDSWSKTDALSPDARALMGTKYNNMMLQAKEAYNLGVLNGPDFQILQSVVTDPRTFTGSITSNAALKKQATELSRIMRTINAPAVQGSGANAAGATGSWDAPKPPQKVPMKGQTVDGYKFMGGDPAVKSNWVKQ